MERKEFIAEIKESDDKEMTLTAFVSTGAIDRQRESLDPEGVDVGHYRKNPVVLWAHDYSMPPIGKAIWVKKTDGGIVSKVQFYNSDKALGEFAQEIYQMYKQGFLNAFSVGFIPKETEYAKEEDRNNAKKPRLTYKKWEMLEYSAVPVPANPEALQMALQKGIVKSPIWKTLLEQKEEAVIQEFNNEEVKTESTATTAEPIIINPGLDELIAENGQLKEQLEASNKECFELRYKLYEQLTKNKKQMPEITVKDLESKALEILNGVIRQHQGTI